VEYSLGRYWLVGFLISEEENPTGDDIEEGGDTDQESTVEPVFVDTEGVRQKFLKKSAELAENANEKANKEKEAKEAEEATPF